VYYIHIISVLKIFQFWSIWTWHF